MHESGENYLETILLLETRNGAVRSIDVANGLGYAKPSISRAMGILRRAGLLVSDENGRLLLTEQGCAQAEAIYERHLLLTRYLVLTLGVDEQTAAKDACRIEHIISAETFGKVKEFVARAGESGVQEAAEQWVSAASRSGGSTTFCG